MNWQTKQINRLFLLATAPFVGLILYLLLFSNPTLLLQMNTESYIPDDASKIDTTNMMNGLDQAEQTAKVTISSIRTTSKLYQQTTAAMASIVKSAKAQALRPEIIYNRRITSKLGVPLERVESNRIRIELYKVNPGTYKGYAMKVKLKDPSAMQMSLGKDKLGGSETTMQAVQRHGAVAGINAGGFADSRGKRYPLSTTMMNGKYLTGFEPSFKNLSFVGLSSSGKLIGGTFARQSDLDKLQPRFGATFVPVLLKHGQRVPIPAKWQTSPFRAPRTVIGNYKDDQLLIIIVDGYDENGGSGATLMELQNKLFHMGVIDAFNLDGGGSSSLILNGRVVNKPSDGNLRQLPTHFIFYK